MDISEKQFEREIESFLISDKGGYEQFSGETENGWVHNRYLDIGKCIYMDPLVEFIEKTQPKEWAKYTKYYGDKSKEKLYHRLQQCIANDGLIHVLRNGIQDMGTKLRICYFKPESELNEEAIKRYNANILGCSRQFRYSTNNTNTIDMVLSVNGIPVVALELNNQFKGQDYTNAIAQYKNDRNSKEFAFRLNNRFLVYFAVDLNQVWMTTQLKDSATYFMPFNMGSNGAGVNGGAGNPHNPNGYDTSYLWEEVLQRDSLLDILHRFITYTKTKEEETKNVITKTVTKEKIIFPRYHQYDVVKKVIADVKANGAGSSYLIEHSAGSGKSNSIAWIAYRLASLHNEENDPIFNSVIVVTNRIVLDSQLQDTINSFEHTPGLVEAIDEKKRSRGLADAINDKKRIIICTIQKFLFAYKDMDAYKGRNFAIIIDEAHQGQSGESARTLRRALIDFDDAVKKYAEEEGISPDDVDLTSDFVLSVLGQGNHANQSFFAFTATPKGETLETFGTRDRGSGLIRPFHVYSMRQAIDEGFILNVLENYTTIKSAFKLIRTSADNPELIEGPAYKALVKYYKSHGYTIAQKTEMIMTNFLENGRYQIGGKGKAMVVSDSRKNAVRYYFAIKDYIKEHPTECAGTDVMVAFSGQVKLEEMPGEEFIESDFNKDADGNAIKTDKKFRKEFHSDRYNILVVANKYQTGFDEPLLHSMYVDKKLSGINAVQTLSRLNRTAQKKSSTFVMDFENTDEDIKDAFLPFYEETMLDGETDINKVYDYRSKIAQYMLYSYDDVNEFIAFMKKQANGKKQDLSSVGKLAGLLKPVIARYNDLTNDDERYQARQYIKKFANSYSYVTQLVRLHDEDLFNEYQYTSHLIRFLPPVKYPVEVIVDKVALEFENLKTSFEGEILLDEKPPVFVPKGATDAGKVDKKKDSLQNIIDKVNERFAGDFTDTDRVIVEGIYNMFMKDDEVKKYQQYAKDNNTEMFVDSLFPNKFRDIVTQCYLNNNESFEKLFNDPEFYSKVQDIMAKELYKVLRK